MMEEKFGLRRAKSQRFSQKIVFEENIVKNKISEPAATFIGIKIRRISWKLNLKTAFS